MHVNVPGDELVEHWLRDARPADTPLSPPCPALRCAVVGPPDGAQPAPPADARLGTRPAEGLGSGCLGGLPSAEWLGSGSGPGFPPSGGPSPIHHPPSARPAARHPSDAPRPCPGGWRAQRGGVQGLASARGPSPVGPPPRVPTHPPPPLQVRAAHDARRALRHRRRRAHGSRSLALHERGAAAAPAAPHHPAAPCSTPVAAREVLGQQQHPAAAAPQQQHPSTSCRAHGPRHPPPGLAHASRPYV